MSQISYTFLRNNHTKQGRISTWSREQPGTTRKEKMMGDYTEHLISMAGGDGGERGGMSGMAEVLHGLRVPYGGRENGYIHIDANAAHAIAAALTAAGFGPVKEAGAVAWDEGVDAGRKYPADAKSRNPYRFPALRSSW